METRMKKYRQASPERARVRTEPSSKPQTRKVPVVYYLCRNRNLEHPHFIEVPLSSPEGLYLRDVIDRLNVLRGKGMPAMYSWSCKRSYKNGFVWHDLSEVDLILPAHGNEYVLKGSELVEESPPERLHQNSGIKLQNQKSLPEPASSGSQETSSSSSSTIERSNRFPQEENLSQISSRPSSCEISPESRTAKDKDPSWSGSLSLTEYKVYKVDRAADASTQTDDRGRRGRNRDTCTRGVSTDELSDLDYQENRQSRIPQKENAELNREEISPPPSSSSTSSGGKPDTLESLIRADVNKINSFRIVEEEQVRDLSHTKLKASNVLMQLISCGSITVKDHHSFGIIPTYRPRFMQTSFASPMFSGSMILGDLDCFSENSRLMGVKLEDKEYFSGSLIETKKHKEGEGEGYPVLKRSSSYNADRTCKLSDTTEYREKEEDSIRSRCIPLTIKGSFNKHLRNEPLRSPLSDAPRVSSEEPACSQGMSAPGDSKRITDPCNVKRLSKRLDAGKEEKLIKIEENLLLELGL
ncbi:protein SOSEKI 3-like [Aristolochia californica]|uniref:protein SOSEKI 3-like n=1 Tax=Aristolochia californica TaxID=171875 RepID=UPI0035DD424B